VIFARDAGGHWHPRKCHRWRVSSTSQSIAVMKASSTLDARWTWCERLAAFAAISSSLPHSFSRLYRFVSGESRNTQCLLHMPWKSLHYKYLIDMLFLRIFGSNSSWKNIIIAHTKWEIR